MSSKYRRACDECQSRHLKCNLVKPCGPCSQAGRPCTESSRYQFRHDDNPTVAPGRAKRGSVHFDEYQAWPKTPRKFKFIFESPESILRDEEFGDPENLPAVTSAAAASVVPLNQQNRDTIPARSFEGISNEWWRTVQVTDISSLGDPTPPAVLSSIPSLATGRSRNLAENGRPLWPLSAKEEAFLMRYFVNELSLWFDYCTKQKDFSTVVVQAAATSPTLHNAILAVTAKFLSVTRDFDRFTPDRYQRECLRTLIPALTAPEAVLDENLFAATVILRFFDEMTERVDSPDTTNHVLGSHMLVNARERARANPSLHASTLRTATLIIELRQEIHIAFMTNRAPPPLAEYCDIDRSLDPADDWMWCNRMVAHTADVLTYCNGDGSRTLEPWRELWEYLDIWEGAIPPSFNPLYEERADPDKGHLFPTLWLANDCHAAGRQYLAMCKILLLAHDPQIPSLGPDRIAQLKENDAQIKTQVRIMCGIAISNRQFFPTMLGAGVAIATCGERFTDLKEQEAFIDILAETEAHVGWPCLKARERLKTCWGWDDS